MNFRTSLMNIHFLFFQMCPEHSPKIFTFKTRRPTQMENEDLSIMFC